MLELTTCFKYERYERENKKLRSDNMRLERENDVLAQQLLSSKISMRADLDKLEDLKEALEKEVANNRQQLAEDEVRLLSYVQAQSLWSCDFSWE